MRESAGNPVCLDSHTHTDANTHTHTRTSEMVGGGESFDISIYTKRGITPRCEYIRSCIYTLLLGVVLVREGARGIKKKQKNASRNRLSAGRAFDIHRRTPTKTLSRSRSRSLRIFQPPPQVCVSATARFIFFTFFSFLHLYTCAFFLLKEKGMFFFFKKLLYVLVQNKTKKKTVSK